MPDIRGLERLKGLNEISAEEREAFMLNNAEKLKQFAHMPSLRKQAAEILYNNQKFVNTFGEDAFNKMNDGSMNAYEARNALLRSKTINDAWEANYSPINKNGIRNNHVGLGSEYEQMSEMSDDAKLKLMQSGYMTASQFDDFWNKKEEDIESNPFVKWMEYASTPILQAAKDLGKGTIVGDIAKSLDLKEDAKNAAKEFAWNQNNKVKERIYNEEGERKAKESAFDVSNAYQQFAQLSDDDVKKAFVKAITPGSYTGNMGIPQYAAFFGNGDNVEDEMEDFSVDDMRQVLAKKAVYERTMSPQMASTVLNNEAQRYIKDHQGSFTRFGLWAKDTGISAMSYTSDKVNGLYNVALAGLDAVGDKPVVWVDTDGEVISPDKIQSLQGKYGYMGEDGKFHPVHQMQVDRRTLHNMGKDFDGRNINDPTGRWYQDMWTLDPSYWTKAEQFGTLDAEEQKQYEQLGASPYKVVYDPNEDTDIWYESAKMMSFGLADGASMFIPFGIGWAGRTLSAAGKAGKVMNGIGKAMQATGRVLGAESKVGSALQGGAGALGIAYAYQRGSFQEMLAENLSKANESMLTLSANEINARYYEDEKYKAYVDGLIAQKAAELKNNYLAQAQAQEKAVIVGDEFEDNLKRAATNMVLQELVNKRVDENKQSGRYAQLQEQAIEEAGDAAFNTFWPEAIKYGLVNTIGHRKFLFKQPTSLVKKAAANFKGITENTLENGKKRLTIEKPKFATIGAKAKQFGKVVGSQVWGGAWTNGTDDMMVDAAEQMSRDSYDRYLDAYENGEALADTYGFMDGFYSYFKGLGKSLGQETTWNAATVGGLGSIMSVVPHFTNIAHYATKEGRQAFKENFQQRFKRNEDGTIMRDKDGKPVVEEVGFGENWRERLGFFIQNGVLNDYYGKKQEERTLQSHVDYVNNLLDDYDDFNVIEELVASDIASQDAESIREDKTLTFVKALNAVNALEMLGNSEKDPTTLSSVVQNAKTLIDRAAEMKFDGSEGSFTEEEVSNLLSQYYAANKGIAQNDANNQKALYQISENAQELKKAAEAYEEAEKQVQEVEKSLGKAIDPAVRRKMKLDQALDGHWKKRVEQMKSELDDSSSDAVNFSAIVPAVGGEKNARQLIKVYEKQQAELERQLEEQKKATLDKEAAYRLSMTQMNQAKNDHEKYEAQQKVAEKEAEWQNEQEKERQLERLMVITGEKKSSIEGALENTTDKNAILAADEIWGLDPVTRARMMNPENRNWYSKEQQNEIEKLEKSLLMKDGNALQKVQDIAKLTQRIKANEDAYARMAQNPEAASVAVEEQRMVAAEAAKKLIDHRNAESIVHYINEFLHGLEGTDVPQEFKNAFVQRMLRKINPSLLDIIEGEEMLPDYQGQLKDAKAWGKLVGDIDAVVRKAEQSDEWKENVGNAIDAIINDAVDREGVMTALEKAIDNAPEGTEASDFEFVLEGLDRLGHQRDAVVIEDRKKRKEREEAARQEAETKRREAEEAAKEAARKAAENKVQEGVPAGTEEEKRKAIEEGGNVPLNFGESKFEVKDEKQDAKRSLPSEIVVKGTSKTGKEREGKYIVNKDVDGFIHLKHEGSGITLRRLSVSEIQEIGLTIDDIIGKKEDYNTPENHDELKKIFEEEGFSIENMTIRPDGTVAVKTNEDYFELVGDKAQAFLDKYFPELKPQGAGEEGKRRAITTKAKALEKTIKDNGSWGNSGWVSVSVEDFDYNGAPAIHVETYNSAQDWQAGVSYRLNEDGQIEANHDNKGWKTIENAGVDAVRDFFSEWIPQQKGETVVIDNMKEGHNDTIGDYVEGRSANAAEEAQSVVDESDKTVSPADTTDPETVNDDVEKQMETSAFVTLSGNAMAEFEPGALREHKLAHKKGEKEGDSMNNYYSWMENAGIKMQKIIDDELPQILANNPHTPVKFMRVRPTPNATHDEYLKNTLLLVVDYDNSINKNITTIHNENNGGVVESAGKKYLIVGTLGYGDSGLNSDRGKAWQSLNNAQKGHKLPAVAWQWFQQKGHEAERFYVHDGFHTEIIPGSMTPGWIINQGEADEYQQSRKIFELLADEERNPHGLKLNDLGWSIVEYTQSLDINTKGKKVMHPQNQDANAGRVFVLIPAGNGKLLTAKVDALYYNDTKFNHESALYQELQGLFMKLSDPDYNIRYEALAQLLQKLYITPEGHNILLAKDANAITFKRGEDTVETVYTKAPNFSMQTLMDAVAKWNPRINITANVLSNIDELKKYDEAGALMTDLAKLGTAGVNYSVYAIDDVGNMILPTDTNWAPTRAESNYQYTDAHRLEIPYLHGESYYYNKDTGTYTKNGVEITDPNTLKGLDYARRLIEEGRYKVKAEGVWDYYILSEGDNAEVIRQSRQTNAIEEVTGEKAQELVKEMEEKKAAAAREAAMAEKLGVEKTFEAEPQSIVGKETSPTKEEKKEEREEKKRNDKTVTPSQSQSSAEGTQTFNQAIRGRNRSKIMDAIKDKVANDTTWADAPVKSPKQLMEYLAQKGVQLDMIPMDEAGFDAWIHDNIECK